MNKELEVNLKKAIVKYRMQRDEKLNQETIPFVENEVLTILEGVFDGNPNVEEVFIKCDCHPQPTLEELRERIIESYQTIYAPAKVEWEELNYSIRIVCAGETLVYYHKGSEELNIKHANRNLVKMVSAYFNFKESK